MKVQIFEIFDAWVKICQILYVNFSSNFATFFIVMTQNFPVSFKLIHFLLWIKGPHQSHNFQTSQNALVKIC